METKDEFLIKVYELHQNKMRWHSEVEYRFLKMFIVITPVIITAIIGINEYITNKTTFFAMTFTMAIFLIFLTKIIDEKIKHEHKSYEAIGQDIVRIWEYFKLFEEGSYLLDKPILSEGAKRKGKGLGYKKTLHVLWTLTYTISILLVGFGLIQLWINS